MYLSKLRIQGFKSFANRVEINFPGDGITAVVGPNGCGKSNIIDAIRWVLGEQRARLLRGSKMEDVIFSGTSDRPAQNMAEVSLVVRNHRGVLPSEFTEIMITRRAFRDGTSEYAINQQPCRLRDIQNLFYDTGLGAASYSLMEQRMIDSILSDKPEDRRSLFEEAAGISRYRSQRKEAQRQLEKTEHDLGRLRDHLGHVRRSVTAIERQARLFETWKSLRAQERELDLTMLVERHREVDAQLGAVRHELAIERAEAAILRTSIAGAETEAAALRADAGAEENRLRLAEAAWAESRAEVQAAEAETRRLREAVVHLQMARERTANEAQRVEHDLASREAELESLRDVLAGLDSGETGEVLDPLRLDEDVRATRNALEEVRRRAKSAEQDREEARMEAMDAREALARAEAGLEARQREVESLDIERTALTEHRGEDPVLLEQSLRTAQQALEAARSVLDAARENRETVQTRHRQIGEAERAAASLRASRQAGLQALESQLVTREGLGRGPRTLLDRLGDGSAYLLVDRLQLPVSHLESLEDCLGESLQWVIARNADTAQEALRHLADQRAGLAIAAVLSRLSVQADTPRPDLSGETGFVGWADDLTRADEETLPAARLLLGRIALVDRAATAVGLAARHLGENLWFCAPDLRVHGCGLVAGGRRAAAQMGLAERRQRRDQAFREFEDAEAALFETRKELEQVREAVQSADRTEREALQSVAAVEREIVSSDARLRSAREETQRSQRRKDELQQRHRTAVAALAGMEETVVDARIRVERTEENQRVSERRAADAAEAVEQALEAHAAARRTQEEERQRMALLRAEHERAEVSLARALERKTALQADRSRLLDELCRLEIEESERQEQGRRAAERVPLLAEAERIASRGREDARQAWNARLADADRRLEGTRAQRMRLDTLQESIHARDLRRAALETDLSRHVDTAFRSWEVDLAALVAETPVVSPISTDLPERLESLRARMKELGPVHPAAEDEYREEKRRLEEIQTQVEDLQTACDRLERSVKRLDRMARERFLLTFEQIRRNFQDVFTVLFGGGEARLELEEGVDALEARIDINARPVGKGMRGVQLLSGGERALTATSLLFALYLIRPSPYCILDEVDGPLDDANIGRFVDLLRRFSHQTQFIVVTHNKRTMAASDMLYGVTQEIRGISQLASVQLDEAERLAG